ncbi:Uncharacterized protein APZ42_000168, partial [Daphnia magna]
LLEQKLTEALSELKCTNTKHGSSQENDATIAATDQYEKGRSRSSERYSRSRDSRVRFADNHNIRESSREKSLSRNRDNSPNQQLQQQHNPGNNPRTTENREIACCKCNRRGHIAKECWTDMARTNNPGSDVEVEFPKLIRIPVEIFNKEIIALVDTDAAASLVSSKILCIYSI